MSDDEYYGNSGCDDFDDYFWDDNISENPADDLAEHTLPSPTYQEDPHYETLEIHSDWEYYSDDYYDDDSSLIKHVPQGQSPIKPKRNPWNERMNSTQTQRGKKRKLQDIGDIPAIDLEERNDFERCIEGVVWAGPPNSPSVVYHEGQNGRVALLKDWKDIFGRKPAKPAKSRKRKFDQDESWANEMSLEDMGLKTTQDQGVPEVDPGDLTVTLEEDEQVGFETIQEDKEIGIESDDEPLKASVSLIQAKVGNKMSRQIKRQKMTEIPSPPPSNESTLAELVLSEENITTMEFNKSRSITDGGKGRNGKAAFTMSKETAQILQNATTGSKKRKAELEHEEIDLQSGTTSSFAITRSKRAM